MFLLLIRNFEHQWECDTASDSVENLIQQPERDTGKSDRVQSLTLFLVILGDFLGNHTACSDGHARGVSKLRIEKKSCHTSRSQVPPYMR